MTDDLNIENKYGLAIYDRAYKRDEHGDLIAKKETRVGTSEINVSKLFAPGKRKSNDVDLLVHEARIADDNPDADMNPAFPINETVADEALERMDAEDLKPAWLQGPTAWKP